MQLTFTHYIDAEPAAVNGRLESAVSSGLDAAAERGASERTDTVTVYGADSVEILAGVGTLDGTELRVTGSGRLTEVWVSVPWSACDVGTTKLWAANRFAGVLADELSAA